jgi:hypothetical protein
MPTRAAITRLHRRLVRRAQGPLEPERARARMSAYVYGTLLALAAVVVVDPHAIDDGSAVMIVLGTTATTFLAHVFADIVAYRTIGVDDDRSDRLRARAAAQELRGTLPIASSGAFPAFFLALGWLGALSSTWAYALASAGPIARIAFAEIAIQRLQDRPMTLRVLVGALMTAAVATAIVAVKVVVAH